MTLHIIIGLMNSGKTLIMSKKGYHAFLGNKRIYSNYYLGFSHIEINRDFLLKLAEEQPSLDNTAFMLDELWIWMDSRGSGVNTSNKLLSYFFLQSSKEDTEIYITSQGFGQNDRRLRDNCHRLSLCSRVFIIDGKIIKIDDAKRFLSPEEQEILYIENKEFKRTLNMFHPFILEKVEYIKAKPIFELFNTRQKIKA